MVRWQLLTGLFVLAVGLLLTGVTVSYSAQEDSMSSTKAVIETSMGNIEIKFLPDAPPDYVNNFIERIRNGVYNGSILYSAEKGNYISGGNPNLKKPAPQTSRGTVKILRETPALNNLTIRKGFPLVSPSGKARYETTEEVVLRKGKKSVSAPIEALHAGADANIAQKGTNLLMINPIYGVGWVETETPISGGVDYPSATLSKPSNYRITAERGALLMANKYTSDGLGYGFIICVAENKGWLSSLNYSYTVIGSIVSGMDIVDKIDNQSANRSAAYVTTVKGLQDIPINRIEMKITLKTGAEEQKEPAMGTLSSEKSASPQTSKRFTLKDGVIDDSRLGLQWVPAPNRRMSHDEAEEYARNLSLAGGGWRLPTRAELRSLYNVSQFGGADPMFKVSNQDVWTSELDGSSLGWFFNFLGGNERTPPRSLMSTYHLRVLAVRSRQ